MKKLKLDLNNLEVESFSTTPEEATNEEGTVFGFISENFFCDPTFPASCDCPSQTCNVSCHGSCGSCNGTCYNTCGRTCGQDCGTFAGLCSNHPLLC